MERCSFLNEHATKVNMHFEICVSRRTNAWTQGFHVTQGKVGLEVVSMGAAGEQVDQRAKTIKQIKQWKCLGKRGWEFQWRRDFCRWLLKNWPKGMWYHMWLAAAFRQQGHYVWHLPFGVQADGLSWTNCPAPRTLNADGILHCQWPILSYARAILWLSPTKPLVYAWQPQSQHKD